MGNATTVNASTKVTAASGRPSEGNAMSATCQTTNATAAYAMATR